MTIRMLKRIFSSKKKNDSNNKTILIIEDVDKETFIKKYLKKKKYKILTSTDDDIGLKMARNHKPDLIIVNSISPKEKRLDLCAKIKSKDTTKHIPVLVITSDHDESEMVDYYANDVDYCLKEPINSKKFLEQVESLLTKK